MLHSPFFLYIIVGICKVRPVCSDQKETMEYWKRGCLAFIYTFCFQRTGSSILKTRNWYALFFKRAWFRVKLFKKKLVTRLQKTD